MIMTDLGEMEVKAPPHVLHALNAEGDTKQTWDPNSAHEVEVAKKSFDFLKKKGFLAYSVDDQGNPKELLREFDPNAGKIIMKPQMAGG